MELEKWVLNFLSVVHKQKNGTVVVDSQVACHAKLKHFLVLQGVEDINGDRVIRIIDPAYKRNLRLDEARILPFRPC